MQNKIFRVGMLIPWVNTAIEDEIPLQVNNNVRLHWTRLKPTIMPKDGHDENYISSILRQIPSGIDSFEGIKLDAICLGCTSASFVDSFYEFEDKSQIKSFTAFEAIISHLQNLNAKKIVLFAPYSIHSIQKEVQRLMEYKIQAVRTIQIHYEQEIRYITKNQLCDIFQNSKTDDVDAILFSCTGLYTMELFEEIKSDMGLSTPLISSNLAIVRMINDFSKIDLET